MALQEFPMMDKNKQTEALSEEALGGVNSKDELPVESQRIDNLYVESSRHEAYHIFIRLSIDPQLSIPNLDESNKV